MLSEIDSSGFSEVIGHCGQRLAQRDGLGITFWGHRSH
jgi:hypothetical protein